MRLDTRATICVIRSTTSTSVQSKMIVSGNLPSVECSEREKRKSLTITGRKGIFKSVFDLVLNVVHDGPCMQISTKILSPRLHLPAHTSSYSAVLSRRGDEELSGCPSSCICLQTSVVQSIAGQAYHGADLRTSMNVATKSTSFTGADFRSSRYLTGIIRRSPNLLGT